MPPVADSARKLIFTLALTAISRYFLLRDRLLGRIAPGDPTNPSRYAVSRMAIPSGSNRLDGVLMMPAISPARAAVLICHGIGEVVDHWFAAQQLLADGGVASLVFDYSGYGRSTGLVGPNQCERDAIAAFSRLQELAAPLPVSILGFSLGTGIAAAILPRVRLHKLVLCAAFTSFRAAAISGGFPRPLIFMSPQVWDTEAALTGCRVPVLIVHGEGDRLFPVQMARDLAAQCASPAKLVIVPELSHDDPYYRPERRYWDNVIDYLAGEREC
jgi:pimeloyl-ACP methyl ester carboxylesterase